MTQSPYGSDPYRSNPPGSQSYGSQSPGSQSYGSQPYGSQPFGANPYGTGQNPNGWPGGVPSGPTGNQPGFPQPQPHSQPGPPAQPTGPNLVGAPARALVGGGAIAVLALIFAFVFWPVSLLLALVAGLYGFLLFTGMSMAAGPQTTVMHARYAWRTAIVPAFSARGPVGGPGTAFAPVPPTTGPPTSGPPTSGPPTSGPPMRGPQSVGQPPAALHGYTLAQASDPATPAQVLAQIAAAAPELRVAIAGNPTTYPDLLQWLDSYGDGEVRAAVARRRGSY